VTEKFEFIDAEYAAYRESDDEYVPLAPGTQVIGRGSHLPYLTGSSWYQLDVSDIPQ